MMNRKDFIKGNGEIDYIAYTSYLEQVLNKILDYAKNRSDGYLEDLKEGHLDCEYCDGVFASCRKVLQLAGEDISEYE